MELSRESGRGQSVDRLRPFSAALEGKERGGLRCIPLCCVTLGKSDTFLITGSFPCRQVDSYDLLKGGCGLSSGEVGVLNLEEGMVLYPQHSYGLRGSWLPTGLWWSQGDVPQGNTGSI